MSATPRTGRVAAAFVTLAVAIVALVGFATSSTAAPYSLAASISVSAQIVTPGGTVTVTGTGFGALENISNVEHSSPFTLAGAHTDANGNFSVVVTLASDLTGAHTIVSTGATSGKSATASITVSSTTATTTGGGGSGLASTGVAVLGIAGLGTVLLIGGGVMLLAGKRRRVSA